MLARDNLAGERMLISNVELDESKQRSAHRTTEQSILSLSLFTSLFLSLLASPGCISFLDSLLNETLEERDSSGSQGT